MGLSDYTYPKLRQMAKYLETLMSYSDAWDFIRKIAEGEMNYTQIIVEAKTLVQAYRPKED